MRYVLFIAFFSMMFCFVAAILNLPYVPYIFILLGVDILIAIGVFIYEHYKIYRKQNKKMK